MWPSDEFARRHQGSVPLPQAVRRFGSPIVRVMTYLPYDLCGFVLEHDMACESLYQVLSEREDTG